MNFVNYLGSLRKKWCKIAENLIDRLCFFMKYASFFHKTSKFLWFSTLKNPIFNHFSPVFAVFGHVLAVFGHVLAFFGNFFFIRKRQISLLFQNGLLLLLFIIIYRQIYRQIDVCMWQRVYIYIYMCDERGTTTTLFPKKV